MKVTRRQARYARALFEAAHKIGQGRAVFQELLAIQEILAAQPDLVAILVHPNVTAQHREALARKSLSAVATDATLDFMAYLARRGHVSSLDGIVALYEEMLLEAEGVARAYVTTAVPITDQERQMVLERLQQLSMRAVEMNTIVDPSIIGGIVIRLGDRVIDGSVRYHLEQMRESLKQARVV